MTSRVLIEWSQNGIVLNSQDLDVSSTSLASSAAPTFGVQPGQAKVSAITGAVVVSLQTPATQTNGMRVGQGTYTIIPISSGSILYFIEAADLPVTGGTSTTPYIASAPTGVVPTPRAASITTGGTAQQLMAANTARRGWSLQNQSTGNLFVRDDGTAATADQNAKLIYPGEKYYPGVGEYVSQNSISIIGATTGQIFYAVEW